MRMACTRPGLPAARTGSQSGAFLGGHIGHAARIEPVAPPGQVYASQAFAALAAADRVPHFACRYIGQMSPAKGYGIYPTYHIQRRH